MKPSVQMVSLWGNRAPPHSITAILITEDQQTIVTGSHEGQICLWDLSPELKISSKRMLWGHTASVTCLAKARDFEKQPFVVSATENGEMCLWSVAHGRCVENTRLPFAHTAICYYHSAFRMAGAGWLLCCGHYDDILILDAQTLVLLHALTSAHAPDWVSCLSLVHSPRIQEDSLIAVSVAGDLKVWDLSSCISRIQDKQCVTERESQPLGCAPCRAIRFCTYTGRLLLVVLSSCWKVYDYCDFSLLWTEPSPSGQCFSGGEVLAAQRLILWTEGGCGYIYQLLNSGLSRSIHSPHGGEVLKETVYPLLLCSTGLGGHKSFSYVMGFMNERKEPFYKILYSGDTCGKITLWHIPDVPASTLDGSPKEIPVAASSTLQDNFDGHSPAAKGLVDGLGGAEGGDREASPTSSIFIPSLNKLVCGCEDGQIVIILALTAARSALLLKDSQPHRILHGHSTRVTSLLYLHGRSARFDPSWLLSGSQDSSVIWWDMFTGEILHHFPLHAGPITDLLLSSENYRFKSHRIVCCVCGDHSVALLHLQERACILHARRHLSPVKTLRWHPVQNLLVIGCGNDSISVWDIESGVLERQESGEKARAILACCEDSLPAAPAATRDPLLPAWEEATFKPREEGGPYSTSYKRGPAPSYHSLAQQEKPPSSRLATASSAQTPFTLLPLKTKWEDQIRLHLLLFDVEKMEELLRSAQLHGLKSSNSFHSCETLKRARSAGEKRALVITRNRTAESLALLDGKRKAAGGEQTFEERDVTRQPLEQNGTKRPKKPKSSKKGRRPSPAGRLPMGLLMETATLLLSCVWPWGVDQELDDLCAWHLGLLRSPSPVSLGLVSKNGHLSLMLPGWRSPGRSATHLFSSQVLDLCRSYMEVAAAAAVAGAAGEQPRKSHKCVKSLGDTERPSTALADVLSRLCFVQQIMRMPLEETSPQKVESARKWRPAAPLGTSGPCDEPADSPFVLPLHVRNHSSLAKLISSWKDQSVEVAEAIQAVLLAEVQWALRDQRKALASGHRQPQATGEMARTDQAEISKSHPWHGPANPAQSDSCISSAQEGEDVAKRRALEEPDYSERKPHPWMSKVCSCKVC